VAGGEAENHALLSPGQTLANRSILLSTRETIDFPPPHRSKYPLHSRSVRKTIDSCAKNGNRIIRTIGRLDFSCTGGAGRTENNGDVTTGPVARTLRGGHGKHRTAEKRSHPAPRPCKITPKINRSIYRIERSHSSPTVYIPPVRKKCASTDRN